MSLILAELDSNKKKGVILLELILASVSTLLIIVFSTYLIKNAYASLLKNKELISASYLAQEIMEERTSKKWEDLQSYDSKLDEGAFWEEDLNSSILKNYHAIITATEIEANLKEIKLDLSWDNEKENIELNTLKVKT